MERKKKKEKHRKNPSSNDAVISSPGYLELLVPWSLEREGFVFFSQLLLLSRSRTLPFFPRDGSIWIASQLREKAAFRWIQVAHQHCWAPQSYRQSFKTHAFPLDIARPTIITLSAQTNSQTSLPHLVSFNSRQRKKNEKGKEREEWVQADGGGGATTTTLINKAATGSCDVQLGITNHYHRVQRESYSSPRPTIILLATLRRFVNFRSPVRVSATM